MTLSNKVK